MRWYGHVIRRHNSEAMRILLEINGESRKEWDSTNNYMKIAGVNGRGTGVRNLWRCSTRVANTIYNRTFKAKKMKI